MPALVVAGTVLSGALSRQAAAQNPAPGQPPDVAAAAIALAREGRLREALSLLYRGALSELVHKRGIELLASHTEGEAVKLAGTPFFAALVEVWRSSAYARRDPSLVQVERLAHEYKAAFP